MIGWVAIIFQNDLIVDVLIVEHNLTMHNISKLSFSLGNLHANDVGLSICLFLFDLFFTESVEAQAIILSLRILLPADFDSHLLKALCSAKAGISVTVLNQSVYEFVVKGEALTLIVGTVRALSFSKAEIRALIRFLGFTSGTLIPC